MKYRHLLGTESTHWRTGRRGKSSGVWVFNNNGVVQVWYDSNVGLDQNGDGVTLLGTITTGSAAADLASLTAAHFA